MANIWKTLCAIDGLVYIVPVAETVFVIPAEGLV